MPIGRTEKNGKKQCSREAGLEAFWREAIAEWQASRLPVRVFVREKKLSEPLFYAWRKELQRGVQETPLVDTPSISEQAAVQFRGLRDARRTLIPVRRKESPASEKTGSFVPVALLDDKPQSKLNPTRSSQSSVIELHLAGGCFIRIFHDTDFALLGRLLCSLEVTKC